MLKSERDAIRQALADYVCSEGCSCCQDRDAHEKARERLAKLLGIRKKDDWYDLSKYRSKK